jgi:hypothetical protein
MPVYTLYLSTLLTQNNSNLYNPSIPINKTNLNNVSWSIKWSDVFKGNEKNYKFCRLRYNLLSVSFPAVPSQWDISTGYVVCNLPSNYNSSMTGTVIGLLSPTDVPTTGTANHCFILNTMNECGVDINVPQDINNIFTLSFFADDSTSFIATMYDYEILLSFELYN